jgi:hypothetical protein
MRTVLYQLLLADREDGIRTEVSRDSPIPERKKKKTLKFLSTRETYVINLTFPERKKKN